MNYKKYLYSLSIVLISLFLIVTIFVKGINSTNTRAPKDIVEIIETESQQENNRIFLQPHVILNIANLSYDVVNKNDDYHLSLNENKFLVSVTESLFYELTEEEKLQFVNIELLKYNSVKHCVKFEVGIQFQRVCFGVIG